MTDRLGIGFIGAGFIVDIFHVGVWEGVRDADITGVTSRTRESAQRVADHCRQLSVGDPTVHDDVAALIRDERVDAVWVAVPNDLRVPVVEQIVEEVSSGRADLTGVAIEKPLGRNVAEAREVVRMIEDAGLLHGYLENQVFAPALTRAKELVWKRGATLSGNPYLARAAEEHSGPHSGWFWDGTKQGGGVLNDMLCHSIEAGRHLLTPPGTRKSDFLVPVSITATIASLKWSRDRYADELAAKYQGIDYRRSPAEDYARATVLFENADGEQVVVEGTTSWSFVGAGLRLSFELLGPEYSLGVSTLHTPAEIFFSRNVSGKSGEDLVEKQNAEQGVMPVLADEGFSYGYLHENRHMVQAFRAGRQPDEDLHDGLLITELMMAAYLSAELGETLRWPVTGLEDYVPEVARGVWNPREVRAKQHRVSG
ncbi:MAG TPA: Gfo/Idh/MocA family oxidoreductase [Euzebyales bacterium]|nr:Gfo/Idh/MocA family oxidoreductase [Euzebyales bacterium]